MKLNSPAVIFSLPIFIAGAFLFVRATSSDSTHQSAPNSTVFDVPGLIGLDINAVLDDAAAQGAAPDPHALDKMKREFPEWDIEFTKSGQTLNVSFVPATGKVVDFFIPSDEPDQATANLARLREIGNLVEKPTNYTIQAVPALRVPGEYTGIKITPTK